MRLAHFSDVHALPPSVFRGTRPWHWVSKRFAGYVNLRLNRREKHPVRLFEAVVDDVNKSGVDHVVVTGDLVNLSLPSELQIARALLDRLALGPSGVTVVPGNHDVYTVDAYVGRHFERAMRPYLESDDPSREGFPLVRRRGDLVVVGISTARPSPVPFADGSVGRRQLRAVEEALADARGTFRVLALHHPPVTNRASFLRGLRDRDALQKVLRRVGCELVLHGHEHRDLRTTVEGPSGPIPVIGVGSGTYDDPRGERRARYNVYHIMDGRLARVETRVHSADGFVTAH
jgi:3',5'-cyclic AMP phosphodiesterase CpdA